MGERLTDDTRLWRVVIACGMAMFLVYADAFAIDVALPEMARDLGTTVADLQWVMSGYLLSLAAFLVVGGRIADLLGRKTWLIVGVAVFGAASLLGGLGTSAEFVITMRIIQGLGAAFLMPVSLAVVTNAFPERRVQRAVGLVLAIAAVGQATGPLIGGALTEFVSWRWVLWINVPIAIIVIVLVATSVHQSFDASAGRRIDWLGLVAVVVSIGAFTYGIDQASVWGWADPRTLGMIAAGLGGLVLFVLWEHKFVPPLVDFSFFRKREFSVMTVSGAAGNMGVNVVMFLTVIYLQNDQGFSPMRAALAFLILSAGLIASAQLAGRLSHFKSWQVMTVSLLIGGAGTVAMGLLTGNVAAYLAASLFAGFGLGMTWAFANVVTQSIVPSEKAGAASGLVLTILIGLGGVATAVAASLTSTGTGTGNSLSTAIGVVLVGFGGFALIMAPVTAIMGRERSHTGAHR